MPSYIDDEQRKHLLRESIQDTLNKAHKSYTLENSSSNLKSVEKLPILSEYYRDCRTIDLSLIEPEYISFLTFKSSAPSFEELWASIGGDLSIIPPELLIQYQQPIVRTSDVFAVYLKDEEKVVLIKHGVVLHEQKARNSHAALTSSSILAMIKKTDVEPQPLMAAEKKTTAIHKGIVEMLLFTLLYRVEKGEKVADLFDNLIRANSSIEWDSLVDTLKSMINNTGLERLERMDLFKHFSSDRVSFYKAVFEWLKAFTLQIILLSSNAKKTNFFHVPFSALRNPNTRNPELNTPVSLPVFAELLASYLEFLQELPRALSKPFNLGDIRNVNDQLFELANKGKGSIFCKALGRYIIEKTEGTEDEAVIQRWVDEFTLSDLIKKVAYYEIDKDDEYKQLFSRIDRMYQEIFRYENLYKDDPQYLNPDKRSNDSNVEQLIATALQAIN